MKTRHRIRVLIGMLISVVVLTLVSTNTLAWVPSSKIWPYGINPLSWNEFYTTTELSYAFYDAKVDWDFTSTPISFIYSEESFQVMGAEYDEDDGLNGYCWRFYVGDNVYAADIWLNWYTLEDDTANERRGTAGHEWGHVFSLSHEVGAVLMNPSRNRSSIYVPQSDDVNGVNDIY